MHVVRSQALPADFYITCLYGRPGGVQMLVVFLKRPAWNAIDGEMLPATLTALPSVVPTVAEIEHGGQVLVVAAYEDWKARVPKCQRREEKRE